MACRPTSSARTASGVRNVLLTTGQPAPEGTYPDATSVFDVDAVGLVNLVARLNRGQDLGGQPMEAATRFHIGVAVNPFAPDVAAELRRLDHKVEAGAEFMLTPPIFDIEAFDAVLPQLRKAGIPIVGSVAALDSLRQAEFFASEVTGARVPDSSSIACGAPPIRRRGPRVQRRARGRAARPASMGCR